MILDSVMKNNRMIFNTSTEKQMFNEVVQTPSIPYIFYGISFLK